MLISPSAEGSMTLQSAEGRSDSQMIGVISGTLTY